MIKNDTIFGLIDMIQQRLGMFIPDKSIYSLQTFLAGYESCMFVHGMIEQDVPDFKHFGGWLSNHVDWRLSYGWARAIYENVADHQQAFKIFFELIREFRKLHPKTVKNVKFGPNQPQLEKKLQSGDEFAVLRLKEIQIVHYIPKKLFFLRFVYSEKIENGAILFSSLTKAQNWTETEFPVSLDQWKNSNGDN